MEQPTDSLPSEKLYSKVRRILIAVSNMLEQPFPKATVSGDDSGIEVYWRQGSRQVHLIVPDTTYEAERIFWKDENSYGSELSVNAANIVTKLEWLRSK